MTRRFKFNILTVLAVSSGSFFSAVAMADGEEDGTEGPGIAEVSIWDDSEALDTASNAGGLQTSSSETIQQRAKSIKKPRVSMVLVALLSHPSWSP